MGVVSLIFGIDCAGVRGASRGVNGCSPGHEDSFGLGHALWQGSWLIYCFFFRLISL